MVRSLYDCPEVPVGPEGVLCRVLVATHPAGKKKSPVGVTRAGVVYELFFTRLPQCAFTASDVVELYLHRGAFEPALSDEDQEIDPDRWCCHSAWGELAWQCVAQWVWNLRLELGHQLEQTPLRTTEFAAALPPPSEPTAARPASSAPASGYGPPTTATRLGKPHELRNEITASRQYSTRRHRKQSWSHCLLAGDSGEVPSERRNLACDEGWSRATLLESCISLRNSWADRSKNC